MKKLLLSLFLFIFYLQSVSAQTGYTKIPDPNFERELIKDGFDDIVDGRVLTTNIENVKYLYISGDFNNPESKKIKDLTGIEAFKSLISLACNAQALTEINLSKNTKLESFSSYNSKIKKVNFSNNLELKTVELSNNEIQEIDFSKNPKLKTIWLSGNQLSYIDLSNNSIVSDIYLINNSLRTLDLSHNPKVRTADTSNNLNLSCVITTAQGSSCNYPEHNISKTNNANGLITLDRSKVIDGGFVRINATANQGYYLKDILVNGKSIGNATATTFYDVHENITVSVNFELITKEIYHTISVENNPNGNISVSSNSVEQGNSLVINVQANQGYLIESVLVNGSTLGDQDSYTLSDIQENKTIRVIFKAIDLDIRVPLEYVELQAKESVNGIISIENNKVVKGGDVKISIVPNEGYTIKSLLVNGVEIQIKHSLVIENIQANKTIEAIFEEIVSVKSVLSLKTEQKSSLVYPNPFRNKIYVSKFPIETEIRIYELSTASLILKLNTKEELEEIDLSFLQDGIYLLRTDNKQSLKLIKTSE